MDKLSIEGEYTAYLPPRGWGTATEDEARSFYESLTNL